MAGAVKLNKTWFTIRLRRMAEASVALVATALTSWQGEPFYSTDTKRFYISDGTTINLYPSLAAAVVFEDAVVVADGEIVWM